MYPLFSSQEKDRERNSVSRPIGRGKGRAEVGSANWHWGGSPKLTRNPTKKSRNKNFHPYPTANETNYTALVSKDESKRHSARSEPATDPIAGRFQSFLRAMQDQGNVNRPV